MILRRAFYYVHVLAALILPVWLLVGWGVFGGGGLELLLVILGAVTLLVSMLVVAGITFARRSVRVDRALSWIDVGVLFAWYAAIIAAGFYPSFGGVLNAAIILFGLAAFWTAIGQLVTDTSRRVKSAINNFVPPVTADSYGPSGAFPGGGYAGPSFPSSQASAKSPYADGEYIVIETSRDREWPPQ